MVGLLQLLHLVGTVLTDPILRVKVRKIGSRESRHSLSIEDISCLLYTSDAADD